MSTSWLGGGQRQAYGLRGTDLAGDLSVDLLLWYSVQLVDEGGFWLALVSSEDVSWESVYPNEPQGKKCQMTLGCPYLLGIAEQWRTELPAPG